MFLYTGDISYRTGSAKVRNTCIIIEVIVCKKYRNIVKEDATRVVNLSDIKDRIIQSTNQ